MVDKDRVRLLVEALESDTEFLLQGRRTLEQKHGGQTYYCCLGVACRVAERNELSLTVDEDYYNGHTFFDGAENLLPYSVVDWYGFSHRNPVLTWNGQEISAANLNDGLGLSFAEIAQAFRNTFLED